MTRSFFSLRWILTTLLVLAAVGVMVWLGLWQLDRLAQRRAFNARVSTQLNAPPLNLNARASDPDLTQMEYRTVTVTGKYDFANQVALRNQVANGMPGVNLITPLIIQGTDRVVFVDRGWIPLEDADPGAWARYDEPDRVTVTGQLQNSRPRRGIGGVPDPTLAPGQSRLATWNFLDLERFDQQVSQPMLPVYIHQASNPALPNLPIRSELELDLSEGSHESYAIQWFSFAAILSFGYPFFVYRSLSPRRIHAHGREASE